MKSTADTKQQDGTVWFVSRHPGAIDWARRKKLAIKRWVEHLDARCVAAGDTVIGTLPVNLAAEVCKRGATYQHLAIQVPVEWRGREMTADELHTLGVSLVAYHISQTELK